MTMGTKSDQYAIPEISDERIKELCATIKPLVRVDGELCFIEMPHPRDVSFIWDPMITGKVSGIQTIAEITTYHTYAYYGFFKPSIAEVLAQIPEEYIGRVTTYEVNGPETAEDLNRNLDALNAGYQVARTILYIAS